MKPLRLSSRVLGAAAAAARGSPRAGSLAAADRAHPVPWRVSRRGTGGAIEFEQCGDGPLRAVRLSLAGGGVLGLSLPRTVHPGERLRVVLREFDAASPDAMLVLRWFQPDGTELLWPVAL
ncbi:hypothetical protein J4H92_00200 [Leucobacter weissii]|uniref:Uncharacterized protein n=1 Tax=Leucobacter weissii TaxID=1983706 RepID=A0A939MGN8_9MICO|nr:hypothetical protein [Leucobacter weissii]MBO1900368.1 hypothetical protein [Leucobacter weissii]